MSVVSHFMRGLIVISYHKMAVYFVMAFFAVIGGVYSSECFAYLAVEASGDGQVAVEAEDELLRDVLMEISKKTRITINIRTQYDDRISCQIKLNSIENVLKELLSGWNHALFTKKSDSEANESLNVWVYKKNHTRFVMDDKTGLEQVVHYGKDSEVLSRKGFRKEQFVQVFKNIGPIKEHIEAITLSAESEIPGPGFTISRLADDSPLSSLGLVEGDIIKDIDGVPVSSVEDFVKILSDPDKDKDGMIRIEVFKSPVLVDPIYIKLL